MKRGTEYRDWHRDCLEIYTLSKLTQEWKNPTRPIILKNLNHSVKTYSLKEVPGPDSSTGEFYMWVLPSLQSIDTFLSQFVFLQILFLLWCVQHKANKNKGKSGQGSLVHKLLGLANGRHQQETGVQDDRGVKGFYCLVPAVPCHGLAVLLFFYVNPKFCETLLPRRQFSPGLIQLSPLLFRSKGDNSFPGWPVSGCFTHPLSVPLILLIP